MNKFKILLLLSLILTTTIWIVGANVTCNPTYLSTSYLQGETPTQSISCSNDGNSSVNITKSGEFSINEEIIGHLSSKSIIVSYNSNAPIGFNSGFINFDDGSPSIPINFYVLEPHSSSCSISIFPTMMNNVKVMQGEKKTRNIQLSIPSCFTSPVSVNGVALLSDTKPLQLGELSLGTLQPGNSIMIPIDIDAVGVSTGTYSDTLQFLLYDSVGDQINVPQVSISVLVSQGIQPISNFSLNDLPVCSLDAIEMSLNTTQKLTCSITNPNIRVQPSIDTKYIEGISVSETSNQYIYTFQPILIGTTSIGAEFIYKNAPLGVPFSQNVRITPSGNSALGGITTKFIFYQDNIKKKFDELRGGEVIVQVIDNLTNNILSNSKLYLNGVESNFSLNLIPNKSYELRSSTPGYLDNVIIIVPSNSMIDFDIIPKKNIYYVGDIVDFNCSTNCSYLLDGELITNPYIFKSPGNKILKVVSLGYDSSELNITIKKPITLGLCSPLKSDWDSHDNVACELSEYSNWTVNKDNILIASGDGLKIEFKTEGKGNYEIKANGESIYNKFIDSNYVWYNPFSWGWVKNLGWWWILIIGGIIFFIYFAFFKEERNSDNIGFGTNPVGS